jgi:hypothetical protein
MLRQAWNDYRGWAKCARDLQTATGRWNQAALVFVVFAAICGAATTWFPESPGSPNAWAVRLALAATLASAVGAYFGREILSSGKEGGWIQARATAEGIKSECFRYAARAGVYAGADATNAFEQRWSEIAKQAIAKGLVRADDDVPAAGDKREPPLALTTEWYKTNRIGGQIDFYKKGRVRNQIMSDRLWWVAFVAGLAAVVCGALGAWVAQYFAPWIGAMTTIAASIAAYGLLDRRKYLVSTYAAMQSSLERILARDAERPMSLTDIVTSAEDLFESEHKAWLDQMLATRRTATTAATNAPEPGE